MSGINCRVESTWGRLGMVIRTEARLGSVTRRFHGRLAGGACVALAAASLTSGGAVAADKSPDLTLTWPAGYVCDFETQLDLFGGQKIHEGGGAVEATGPLKVVVTNTETGGSAKYNISGPGFVDSNVLRGQWLVYQPVDVGPTFLFINKGRVVLDAPPPEGKVVSTSGKKIDVCAALGQEE